VTPNRASAESVEQFYKGKTIQLMIGDSAGGDNDSWARMIAQRLGSYIAGHPTVVPVNVPGSGGLLLANEIYNALPQDGTVVGLLNRSLPFERLLGTPGVQFDSKEMKWIGSPDFDTDVCAARKDAEVHNIFDLQTKRLLVGATGVGTGSANNAQVLSNLLGLKFRIVTGYPGSHDIALAVERGEVQGQCLVYDTLARQSYFRQGKINILLQMAAEPDPRLPNVPVASALAKSEEDTQALNLYDLRSAVGRPFVAGPGVPDDRIAALRAGFTATMKDSTLLDEARDARLHPRFVSAERTTNVIAAAYATPKAALDRLKRALAVPN
jgi:tripartite-type tricarboxylate transporter receptor subunit TctC